MQQKSSNLFALISSEAAGLTQGGHPHYYYYPVSPVVYTVPTYPVYSAPIYGSGYGNINVTNPWTTGGGIANYSGSGYGNVNITNPWTTGGSIMNVGR